MADAQNTKTVRGINIAILVLSILCIIGTTAVIALSALTGAFVAQHSDQIVDVIANEIDLSDVDVTIDDAEDLEALAEALQGLDDDQFAEFISALKYASKGDLTAMMDLASDGENLSKLVHAIGSLSAEDVASLSDQLGIEEDELLSMVSDCRSISEADLKAFQELMDGQVLGEIAGITVGIGYAMMLAFLLFTLLGGILSLISSILAIRNAENSKKLGGAFVLAIIAAIIALLTMRFISGILLIFSAVYVNKARKTVVHIPRAVRQ